MMIIMIMMIILVIIAIVVIFLLFFYFQSIKEGDPSTKVVFQGALHLKIL